MKTIVRACTTLSRHYCYIYFHRSIRTSVYLSLQYRKFVATSRTHSLPRSTTSNRHARTINRQNPLWFRLRSQPHLRRLLQKRTPFRLATLCQATHNNIYTRIERTHKHFIDSTGRFPLKSRAGHEYLPTM
jgi:hypothetical protein